MKKSSAKSKAKTTTSHGKPHKSAKKSRVAPPAGSVVVDVRSGKERRGGADRRQKSIPVAVDRRQGERRAKVNRRRQIDPTTCERDYSQEEIQFMSALDEYKRRSGRMFPTCSEILEVVKGLGYEKRPDAPVIAPTFETHAMVAEAVL